jgi:phenylacetate-CoA ligase
MDREALRALQLEKLRRLLPWVYEASPYYRQKLEAAGVDPQALETLDQYQDYPFFDKDEERLSQEQSKRRLGHPLGLHVSCDIRLVNRISASSGTTGSPTFSGFTAKDRRLTDENMARALVRMGIEPGDRVLHASVLSMWIAGLPMLDAMLSYGACVVPVGALSGVERVAQIAAEVRPRVMMCTVSFAQHLLDTMAARTGIEPASLGIEKLVVFGEPGGGIEEIYGPISDGFGGAMVYDIMGATGCHSPVGVSCEAHAGIHYYAEDNAHFEIVDPKTLQPLPIEDGVEGEIVYTGLERECGPLIRWRDKDIIQVRTEPCRCGRPGHRMVFKGRVDDMLLVRGVNVFPNAVRDVVNRHSALTSGNIRILKSGPGPVVEPPVVVDVEVRSGAEETALAALKSSLEAALHDRLRFRAEVRLVDEAAFEVMTGATGKTKLVEQIEEERSP